MELLGHAIQLHLESGNTGLQLLCSRGKRRLSLPSGLQIGYGALLCQDLLLCLVQFILDGGGFGSEVPTAPAPLDSFLLFSQNGCRTPIKLLLEPIPLSGQLRSDSEIFPKIGDGFAYGKRFHPLSKIVDLRRDLG